MKATQLLHNLGQSLWLDNITRDLLQSGTLKQYIADQEKHHQRETFQDEFRRICRKYGVEIDERYVWD